jgi:5'-3' exoribonuclease 1
LDTGALVKDYEGPDKEVRMAWQMTVSQVTFEDERYIEQPAPPVEDEFPEGERVIYVGQQAYGTAAQVVRSGNNTLDVSLAVSGVFPSQAISPSHVSKAR